MDDRFNISDDFSLIIKHVKVEDTGCYICEVSGLGTGFLYLNMVEVTVIAAQVPAGRVWTKPRASLSNGSAAILPCHYTRRTYGVYWKKENGNSDPEGDTIVQLDTFFNVGERSGPGLDEGRFNISDDFSLIISPVMIMDEGHYSCEVSDVSTGMTYSNSTEVTVSATQVPAVLVGTKPRASLSSGSTAILPCHYTGSTYGVYWKKENGHSEPGGNTIAYLDTYFNVGERICPGLDEGRFNISDDFSLVISPVMIMDEGRFYCEVSDVSTGMIYSNSTDVTVFVYARKPYVNIKPCEHSALVNQSEDRWETQCTKFYVLNNQTSFQINCSVEEAKPNVSLSWMSNNTSVDTNYALMSMFEDRGDGTFDQTLTMTGRVNETINGTEFTCMAEGLAVDGVSSSCVTFLKAEVDQDQPDIPVTGQQPDVVAIVVTLTITCAIVIISAVIIFVRKRKKNGENVLGYQLPTQSVTQSSDDP